MNINPELIEKKIGNRTRVIIATHIFGVPCQIKKIIEIADRRRIFVIEDCAHALGVKIGSKHVGSFGKAAFFSFSMGKHINTFGGGMIVTNEDAIAEYAKRRISSSPPNNFKMIFAIMTAYMERLATRPFFSFILLRSRKLTKFLIYLYSGIKNKSRRMDEGLSALQSFIGRRQLENLNRNLELRAKRAEQLKGLLANNFYFQESNSCLESSNYFFVIRPKNGNSNDIWADKFSKEGIDVGIRDEIMDNCPRLLGLESSDYTESNKLENSAIQLPLYEDLSDTEIKYIASVANKIYQEG